MGSGSDTEILSQRYTALGHRGGKSSEDGTERLDLLEFWRLIRVYPCNLW